MIDSILHSQTVEASKRLSRVGGCFCGLAPLGLPFSVDIQNDLRLAALFMSIRLSLVGWFDGRFRFGMRYDEILGMKIDLVGQDLGSFQGCGVFFFETYLGRGF